MTDTVLVVDFGAQYARLIARRVREAHVYSEIVPSTISVEEISSRRPKGIIFSGGPKSVYETPAPSIDPAIYELGIPILGLCYGAQLIALHLGGTVAKTGRGEYGRTPLTLSGPSPLCADWPVSSEVWMSHGDAITEPPPGFVATAASPDAPVAAMHDAERRIFALQFHPEVVHTERGGEVFERFLLDACGCLPSWTHVSIIEQQVAAVRAQVGDERVLCALSGGVDSAVAAALVHKAIGAQLTCVFVDTGLMRSGEAGQVEDTFRRQFNIDLVHVKAADRYFAALAGVTDPERKRKIIGELFIRIFEEVPRVTSAPGTAARNSWSRARSTLMSSSRAVTRPPTSSRTTTSVACPTISPSTWSSRSGSSSRTRSARSARSSACPTTSSGASRSPVPASACASSARSHPNGPRSCAMPTRSWSRRYGAPVCTVRSGRASRCCRPCGPSA